MYSIPPFTTTHHNATPNTPIRSHAHDASYAWLAWLPRRQLDLPSTPCTEREGERERGCWQKKMIGVEDGRGHEVGWAAERERERLQKD